MEEDFLLSNGSKLNFKLTPIEVKSSKNYQTKSLTAFKEKYHERIAQAVVIHPKNLKEEDGILFIPVYMTMCL